MRSGSPRKPSTAIKVAVRRAVKQGVTIPG
jgi:hypothetical protein